MYLDIFFTGLPFWPFQVMLYQAGPYIGPFCSFWALFCRIFYYGSFVVSIGLFGRFWPFWPKRQNWPKMSQKVVQNWLKGPTSWSSQYIPESFIRNFFGTPCSQGKKHRWGREWVNESVLDEKALDREWVARESAIAGLLLPHTKLFLYIPQQGNIS